MLQTVTQIKLSVRRELVEKILKEKSLLNVSCEQVYFASNEQDKPVTIYHLNGNLPAFVLTKFEKMIGAITKDNVKIISTEKNQ